MSNKKRTPMLYGVSALGALALVSFFLLSDTQDKAAVTDPVALAAPLTSVKTPQAESAKRVEAGQEILLDQDGRDVTERTTPQRLDQYFSPNLEGTDIDGQIRMGSDGRIELDLAVKDFIDYFLSASDDVTPEVAIEEMIKVVEASLGGEAREQVMDLLDSYLSYKEQAMALMAQPMLPPDQQTREYQLQMMETTLAELRVLRRETLGEEVTEAFYGLEEAYEDYSIASMKIQMDDTLSQEQKANMVSYHRSQLPPVIRRTEERMVEDQQRNAAAYELISSAKTEEELSSSLDQLGYTGAQKQEVIEYHRGQREFDERYTRYQQERQERLSAVTDEERRKNITTSLLQKYFEGESELAQARVRDLRG